MSLCRLPRGVGRRSEDLELLGKLYGSFSEGLDTADLVEARALLDS